MAYIQSPFPLIAGTSPVKQLGSSPLKQDVVPDWSMSAKHFKKDVGYGSRSRTDAQQMSDNKYYYTHATPKNPHGTRTEKSLFDKIVHRAEKVRKHVDYKILGNKSPGQIKKEEATKINKGIKDSIEAGKFDRFLQDFPFEEGKNPR